LIAPVVDHMARCLMAESTRLYVDETTAPVLDPGRGKTKSGYLWAVLRDDRGWNGPAPPGVVFHYRPGRKGEYADEILTGFDGTIQVDAYGGYAHLAKPDRKGGKPLQLAFCWAHGRRKLIKAKPKKGSPIVDEALVRIAALYKIEDAIRGSSPDHRRAVRQDLSRPLVDAFFSWLAAQAARISQIRPRRRTRLHAPAPGGLPALPRRWPCRNGFQPGRKCDPQPGHEPPQRALRRSR
jgi:transposase